MNNIDLLTIIFISIDTLIALLTFITNLINMTK